MKLSFFASLFLALVSGLLFSCGAVAAAADFPTCLTGSWYEAATSGNGVVIDSSKDATVAYVYFFNAGKPYWFVAAKREDSATDFDLIAVKGTSIKQPRTGQDVIGVLTLQPTSADTIEMTMSVDILTEYCSGFSPAGPLCLNRKHLTRLTQPVACAE